MSDGFGWFSNEESNPANGNRRRCGFLAYVWVLYGTQLYATKFDLRQSLLGSGLLFILLWEFIFWIIKRQAQTDEEPSVPRKFIVPRLQMTRL